MSDALLGLLIGILAGAALVYVLMQRAADAQIAGEVAKWKASELYAIRREALAEVRPDVRRRVGVTVARWTHAFPFRQSDARFIGHPVDYLVFDGYSDLRAGAEATITRITFVAVADGTPHPDAQLVAECVQGGRVRWLTLEITPASGAR